MGRHHIELVEFESSLNSKEALSEAHSALARCFHTKQQIQLQTKKQQQELQQQAEQQIADLNEQMARHFSQIHEYVSLNREKLIPDAKLKSIGTATGRIGWEKARDRMTLTDDEEVVIERLRTVLGENAQSFIVTKESLDLAELKKNHGLVDNIKGLVFEEGADRFYVKVSDTYFEVKSSIASERFVTQT